MENCKKCGSSEIETKFVTKGDLIDSSSISKVVSEFTNNSEYDYFYKVTAKKDHLRKRCLNCNYIFRVRTLDDKSAV